MEAVGGGEIADVCCLFSTEKMVKPRKEVRPGRVIQHITGSQGCDPDPLFLGFSSLSCELSEVETGTHTGSTA